MQNIQAMKNTMSPTLKSAVVLFPVITICVVIIYWWLFRPNITTFVLVRHAEKANIGADPPLSAAGLQRAEKLAFVLSHMNINAIYATQYRRTQETVEEVAEAENLEVIQYEASSDSLEIRQFLTEILENRRGERILIAGHSNTIPVMLNILGEEVNFPIIEEHVFDNLFISPATSLDDNEIYHLKYGTPSE